VIDPGGLDLVTPRGGQFRYVVDLVHGLCDLRPPASFVVLGGTPRPIPELAAVFATDQPRWRYVPFVRPTGRGAMYREQVRLTAALLGARADLYHSLHTVIPVVAPCPVVTTVLDLMFELFPEYAGAVRSRPYRLYRWAVRHRARRAICISRATAADAARLWRLRPERLDVVHLGTTFLDGGATAAVPGVAAADRVVLSTYNLEPRKNLAGLLRAFALLRPPGTRLVLYGRAAVTAEREREYDALVEQLGLGAAVLRTGYLTEEQLGWLYRRAEVFVFPSLYEGFGYPVLEAMAAGACVVARRASAMAEVVGPDGVLVETADPAELAAALDRLLADPAERDRLRRQAVARAGHFTVRRMAEQTWRTYETSLAARARCPALPDRDMGHV
jgi:glycosyltransferase involved in cell wall biosynthesis